MSNEVATRAVRNERMKQMRESDPANKACVDCGRNNPQWASVNNSCFFCIECSGRHRSVGVHISFVRSCTMDSWTMKQLKAMEVGGNGALKKFFKDQGFRSDLTIEQRYGSRAGELYRERIKALLTDQRPSPIPKMGFTAEDEARFAPKPKPVAGSRGSSGRAGATSGYGSGSMQGFGSGGSSQQPASGNDMFSSLSDGFFSAANYTSKAAAQAATVVAASSAQAAEVLKKKTEETTKTLADKDLSSTLKSSATSGWGTFSSWVGQASASLGEAANTLTEAVVGDQEEGAPSLYRKESAPPQAARKFEGFGSAAPTGDDFFSEGNYGGNGNAAPAPKPARKPSGGRPVVSRENSSKKDEDAPARKASAPRAASKKNDDPARKMIKKPSQPKSQPGKFAGFGEEGEDKPKEKAKKPAVAAGGFGGFDDDDLDLDLDSMDTKATGADWNDADLDFDLDNLEIDTPKSKPGPKQTAKPKAQPAKTQPKAKPAVKAATEDGWGDDDLFTDF